MKIILIGANDRSADPCSKGLVGCWPMRIVRFGRKIGRFSRSRDLELAKVSRTALASRRPPLICRGPIAAGEGEVAFCSLFSELNRLEKCSSRWGGGNPSSCGQKSQPWGLSGADPVIKEMESFTCGFRGPVPLI